MRPVPPEPSGDTDMMKPLYVQVDVTLTVNGRKTAEWRLNVVRWVARVLGVKLAEKAARRRARVGGAT